MYVYNVGNFPETSLGEKKISLCNSITLVRGKFKLLSIDYHRDKKKLQQGTTCW